MSYVALGVAVQSCARLALRGRARLGAGATKTGAEFQTLGGTGLARRARAALAPLPRAGVSSPVRNRYCMDWAGFENRHLMVSD